jgi:hypothetical protein
MTSIFFILAVFFLFYEIGVALKPSKVSLRLKQLMDKDNFKDLKTEDKIGGCLFSLVQMLYLVWTVIGLAFASQWILFALLFLIGAVSGIVQKAFRMKSLENSGLALGLRSIDALLCAFIIFDIFMTHFRGDVWGTGLVRMLIGL